MKTENNNMTPGEDRLVRHFESLNELRDSNFKGFDTCLPALGRHVLLLFVLLAAIAGPLGCGHTFRVSLIIGVTCVAVSVLLHLWAFLESNRMAYARLKDVSAVFKSGTPTDEFANELADRQELESNQYASRLNTQAFILLLASVACLVLSVVTLVMGA